MRKDIEIHIQTGDVTITPQNKIKTRNFQWVDHPTGLSRYIYGEVDLPSAISEANIRSKGFCVTIPYTPIYKEFMIRIRRVYEDGSFVYLHNQVDGSEWFLARVGLYGQERGVIRASELYAISESSYYISILDNFADIYSAAQSDFNIVIADRQNSNCLLACNPTNNYRYPITGVGLSRWINANHINSGELAGIIQREFGEDGMTVIDAAYNYDTQQMEMNIAASNT